MLIVCARVHSNNNSKYIQNWKSTIFAYITPFDSIYYLSMNWLAWQIRITLFEHFTLTTTTQNRITTWRRSVFFSFFIFYFSYTEINYTENYLLIILNLTNESFFSFIWNMFRYTYGCFSDSYIFVFSLFLWSCCAIIILLFYQLIMLLMVMRLKLKRFDVFISRSFIGYLKKFHYQNANKNEWFQSNWTRIFWSTDSQLNIGLLEIASC